MIHKKITKYIPTKKQILNNKSINWLGKYLLSENLWNANKQTVSKSFLIGLFWAFIPIPFQMIPTAMCAILLGANIPISLSLVWITNPITIPFIFYGNYLLGCLILNIETINIDNFSAENILVVFNAIWQPLLIGSVIVSIISAIAGYIIVNCIYNYFN